MSGKYVPPSKRAGFTPKTSELPPGYRPKNGRSNRDDLKHVSALERVFDIRQQGTFNYFSFVPPDPPPPAAIRYDPSGPPESIPLPPSPLPGTLDLEHPHPLAHLVAYIVMFGGAHPFWKTNAELWSHTDADKLIQDEVTGAKKNFGRPIPVFSAPAGNVRLLAFEGWWMLDRMRVVPPHSEELRDLHETKERRRHTPRMRTERAWEESLSCTWIKTRFIPVDTTDPRFNDLPNPFDLSPGEGTKLVLKLGGLDEELKIWEEEVPTLKAELTSMAAKHQAR